MQSKNKEHTGALEKERAQYIEDLIREVEQDFEEARKWFKRAAENGHENVVAVLLPRMPRALSPLSCTTGTAPARLVTTCTSTSKSMARFTTCVLSPT